MPSSELKPCPFCGGKNALVYEHPSYDCFDVGCKLCTARLQGFKTKESASSAWNTRSPEKLVCAECDSALSMRVDGKYSCDCCKKLKHFETKFGVRKMSVEKAIEFLNRMQSDGSDELEYCSHQDKQSFATAIVTEYEKGDLYDT